MKKLLLALIPFLLLCASGFSQTVTHTVTLSWTPSPSACVTAVNVHRVIVSGTETIGQPGSNFATVPVGTNTFSTTMAPGTTRYFTVSAFGSTCGESVSSNEVSVTTPPVPSAPTGLNVVVQ